MTRRALLMMTLWLAAAGAHAEPQAEDGVLDPWARVKATPLAATWSPPTVALIVNPWGEQVAHRIKAPSPPTPPDPLDQIVDPWGTAETLRTPSQTPRWRKNGQTDLNLVEIVDPWAGRPTVPTAAFPAEGVVDPWQSSAVNTPGRPSRYWP